MNTSKDHPDLQFWHENVGPTVTFNYSRYTQDHADRVNLLCWNVAIGSGDIDHILDKLTKGEWGGLGEEATPMVIMLQEVYRRDDSIPLEDNKRYRSARLWKGERWDILEFARKRNLSVVYAPSMRNGGEQSDRGNAILTNRSIIRTWEFTLPYVRRRRTIVGVELAGIPSVVFVNAHFDTMGHLKDQGSRKTYITGGRVAQAEALGHYLNTEFKENVVLGADLNTVLGRKDPAYHKLLESGLTAPEDSSKWKHTFHAGVKLHLDHVFYRSSGAIDGISLQRLDENSKDDTWKVFGSDHHPLLANIKLKK